MTVDEFRKYLEGLPYLEDLLVFIRYKYDYDTKWTYANEVMVVDMDSDCYFAWLNDWYEGQENIEILGCMYISEINVPENLKRRMDGEQE